MREPLPGNGFSPRGSPRASRGPGAGGGLETAVRGAEAPRDGRGRERGRARGPDPERPRRLKKNIVERRTLPLRSPRPPARARSPDRRGRRAEPTAGCRAAAPGPSRLAATGVTRQRRVVDDPVATVPPREFGPPFRRATPETRPVPPGYSGGVRAPRGALVLSRRIALRGVGESGGGHSRRPAQGRSLRHTKTTLSRTLPVRAVRGSGAARPGSADPASPARFPSRRRASREAHARGVGPRRSVRGSRLFAVPSRPSRSASPRRACAALCGAPSPPPDPRVIPASRCDDPKKQPRFFYYPLRCRPAASPLGGPPSRSERLAGAPSTRSACLLLPSRFFTTTAYARGLQRAGTRATPAPPPHNTNNSPLP